MFNIEQILDKGEISLLYNEKKIIKEINETFYNNKSKELVDISSATFYIKCPLFIQLYLSKFNLKIIDIPEDKIEIYIPNVQEIKAKTIEDKKRIYKYFEQTMNALIINAETLPQDGCDPFIAQTTMPISVYSKLIVHGYIDDWIKVVRKSTPYPISAYTDRIRYLLGEI